MNSIRLKVGSTQKYLSIPLSGYFYIYLRDGNLRCTISTKNPLTDKRFDIEVPITETEVALLLQEFSRFNSLTSLRRSFHEFLLDRSLINSTHYYHINKLKDLGASDVIRVPDSLVERAMEKFNKQVAQWDVGYKRLRQREERERDLDQQKREEWCRAFARRRGICDKDTVWCVENHLRKCAEERFSGDRQYVSTEVEWLVASYEIRVMFDEGYGETSTRYYEVKDICP